MSTTKTQITEVGQVSGTRIGKTTALNLMKNSKGRFFTVVFTKKDGKVRTMNCQYLKDQTGSELGYVKVQKTGKSGTDKIRNVNIQTLRSIYIGGKILRVN